MEIQGVSADRMIETEYRGVERLSVEIHRAQHLTLFLLHAAVNRIAEQWMANARHMHADLVRAARFQLAFDERCVAQFFDDAPVGNGAFAPACVDNRHLLAIMGGAGERGIYCSAEHSRVRGTNRSVAPDDGVFGELPRQPFMRAVCFCHDKQAGRILINAVDDAGPSNAANARKPPRAVMQQSIDQRTIKIASRWVNDETRRLINDQQMIIFKHDVEWYVLRRIMGDFGRGHGEAEVRTFLYFDRRITSQSATAACHLAR